MTETYRPSLYEGASEYNDPMVALLQWIWGRDFMAPGGKGNVTKLVQGLELENRKVLDIGCGLGGPAFVLARDHGAQVIGIDLEAHLVKMATARAKELGLSSQVTFRQVDVGPLTFDDESFDLVLSSGAVTQTEDKPALFREMHRVLTPGGSLRCYDWMKSPGPYSDDMRYWFELEGLTYAMETLERHGELLEEAGFRDIELEDASDWYRPKVREEYELLSGTGYSKAVELIGQEDADHLIEDWRAMVVVCEKGEMLQGYVRAIK